MDHFLYRNGQLHAEGVSLAEIADAVGTPFYCYSAATLERHYEVFAEAMRPLDCAIAYAVKANSCLAVIATLARKGAGADVVSEGEIRRVLAAGVAPDKIVFSGVGKTPAEMAFALEIGVKQFNVESEPELAALNAVALEAGKRAPITLRVNPDVDAGTHDKISTGRKGDKFGIAYDDAERMYHAAAAMKGIEIVGIDMHIGSQLTDLAPFEAAYTKMRGLVERLEGAGIAIRRLDLGGGLGVPYEQSNSAPPAPAEYGAVVRKVFAGMEDREFEIEPGRLIAANAGILVSKVIYVKESDGHRFMIIDAAMNDLIRPALYNSHHDIVSVVEPSAGAERLVYDVVGPICESGDTFAKARELPKVSPGDLVAFRSAGAYGAVMASEYNTRPPAPEVIVRGDSFAIARPRITYEAILSRETLPDWLVEA